MVYLNINSPTATSGLQYFSTHDSTINNYYYQEWRNIIIHW